MVPHNEITWHMKVSMMSILSHCQVKHNCRVFNDMLYTFAPGLLCIITPVTLRQLTNKSLEYRKCNIGLYSDIYIYVPNSLR